MKLQELNKITSGLQSTDPMPVFFFGHGSPMNALENNEFTRGWKASIKNLPQPAAILCISAHWETKGTFVTAMEKPRTIHDFGGFPQELFAVNYPASGSPELARETKKIIHRTEVGLDEKWGLDHGTWSVVKQLYPDADIPVIQLSLDYTQEAEYHYELAKELSSLRRKGILIIGSGNMVHNLGMLNWQQPESGFDWANEANQQLKKLILENEHSQLVNYQSLGKSLQLSVPTPEHYLPLIYTLGLKDKADSISFFNDKLTMGSISMTSLKIGKS